MADDKRISELTDGGAIRATDDIPVVRGGANVRARVATAGTKAASDPTKPAVASVSGAVTPGHMAVYADDDGTIEDGGRPPAGVEALLAAPILSSVFLDDYVPVIHNGVLYRALVSRVLAATATNPPAGGRFNFSTAANSGIFIGAF